MVIGECTVPDAPQDVALEVKHTLDSSCHHFRQAPAVLRILHGLD